MFWQYKQGLAVGMALAISRSQRPILGDGAIKQRRGKRDGMKRFGIMAA